MSARPIIRHLAGPRRGAVDELPASVPSHGVLIGREAQTCLVRFPDTTADVSRRHAQIWLQDGEWWIRDLGSSNGTEVDGIRLAPQKPTELRNGARIVLAGHVTLRFESTSARRFRRVGPGMQTLKLGIPKAPPAPLPDELGEEDEITDVQGVSPEREARTEPRRPPAKLEPILAQTRLDKGPSSLLMRIIGVLLFVIFMMLVVVGGALYALYDRGRQYEAERADLVAKLDDYRAKDEARRERLLELVAEHAVEERALLPDERAPLTPMKGEARQLYEELRAMAPDGPDEELLGDPLAEHVRRMLGLLVGDPAGKPVDRLFLWEVEDQLVSQLRDTKSYCRLQTMRGELMPLLHEELERWGDPLERADLLLYIPWIESNYYSGACSFAAARGMWQFIPSSANHYGLRVDGSIDERCDWRKATRAAVHHFHDGFEVCGDDFPLLAVASYNTSKSWACGLTKKDYIPRDDRDIIGFVVEGYLHPETMEYLPKLLAASFVGEDYDAALAVAQRRYPKLSLSRPDCSTQKVPISAPCRTSAAFCRDTRPK